MRRNAQIKLMLLLGLNVIFICLYSCENISINEKGIEVLEIPHFVDTLSISDEFCDFEIIPLSNEPKALLRNPMKMVVNDSSMLILDGNEKSLCIFSRDGKFRGNVGRIGHAADEFTRIQNFNTNNSGDTVAVVVARSTKFYDKNGRFMFSKDNTPVVFWDEVLLYQDKVFYASYHRNTDCIMSITDINTGHIVKKMIPTQQNIVPYMPEDLSHLQQDSSSICFHDITNATFHIVDKCSGNISKTIVLSSDNISTEEKTRNKENGLEQKYDIVERYVYHNGIIRGRLCCFDQEKDCMMHYNFRLNVKNNEFKLFFMKDFDYIFACHYEDCYYLLIAATELVELANYHTERSNSILRNIGHEYNRLKPSLKETDNFYVIKMKLKDENKGI